MRRDAAVGFRRLADLRAVLGHAHGAELVDGDLLPIQAVAALFENDGARRGGLDQDRDQQQQRQEQQQDRARTAPMSVSRLATPR